MDTGTNPSMPAETVMKYLLPALAAALLAGTAQAQEISGPASPVDGDSFEMTGTGIRLYGIDAPEGRQTCERNGTTWACGEEAAETMRGLLASGPVRCIVRETDVYDRKVATCLVGRIDLAEVMVRSGLAIALARNGETYREAETSARARRAGIWAGTFEQPADWRARNKGSHAPRLARPAQPRAARPAPERVWRNAFGCAIKGNISRRQGEAIYYLPGMKYYEETRPEALFCTESQARAAGYRRSRGGR